MALILTLPRTSAGLGDTRRFQRFDRLPHYVLRHSRTRDAEAISFTYDTSNEFYALWLGTRMVYTCGYFRKATDTLDEAQTNKLEHVCRKLRLKPGERLLDLGCGWGALMEYAAERHTVTAHGVSLSAEQVEYANARFARAGLADRCRAELRDCRTLVSEPPYDKISAVGIIEHIGIRKFPVFFSLVNRLPARSAPASRRASTTRSSRSTSSRMLKRRSSARLCRRPSGPGSRCGTSRTSASTNR
jgi:cyclopropane fatty-acyl-phospholipid synthase-like methyltransferase